MDIALVQDLSDLAPRLQDGHTNEAGLKEATDLLSKIDQRLKDQRESPHSFPVSGTRGYSSYDQANAQAQLSTRLGQTPLPSILARLLRARPHAQEANESTLDAFFPMIRMNALVASRLSLDNASNVAKLNDAHWPKIAMGIITNAVHLPADNWKEEVVGLYAPLISGLGTLLTGKDADAVIVSLATEETYKDLVKLATTAYTPGDWVADADKARVRGTIVGCLWEILCALSRHPDFNLTPAMIGAFTPVLKFWTTSADYLAPANLASLTKEQRLQGVAPEIAILHSVSRVLYNFTVHGKVDWAGVAGAEPELRAMVDFLERPGPPAWVDQGDWDANTKEGVDKVVAMAQTNVGQTLLLTIGHVPDASVPGWLKQRTEAWLDDPTMTHQGLSALANTIHDGDAAIKVLQQRDLLPRLLKLMTPEQSVQNQHALLGLLRNLSIPKENIPKLGQAVLDGVIGMKPWAQGKDGVEQLQRNAVLTVSHLVTDPELAAALLTNEQALIELMMLLARTRNGTLKAQVVDLLATAINALPAYPAAKDAWHILGADDGIWVCLILGIDDGRQVPVLLANSMRAFLHGLTADGGERKGDAGEPEGVRVQLGRAFARKLGNTGATGVDSVARLIAPPDDVYKIPEAVQDDAVKFVRGLKDKRMTDAVEKAVKRNKKEGRPVAAAW